MPGRHAARATAASLPKMGARDPDIIGVSCALRARVRPQPARPRARGVARPRQRRFSSRRHRQGTRSMDLGIAGRTALVCAASKGLGRGCAQALAAEGARLVIVARTRETLEAAVADIRARTGADVTAVACDITTPEGRAAALAACPQPDILVTNAGGPPPGDFRDFSHDDWIRALEANMLTPIELIRASIDGMIARRFGRIVNITSSAVKAPIDVLALSNGARSGLTGFVAGLARKVAEHNVTINNLLPGLFDTDRIATTLAAAAKAQGATVDELRARRTREIPAKRLGTPDEFGAACAFLCSVHAGYITGQNWLLDGGAYPGTF
ncbi:oxidoreductase, short chain dehydrogenase/reductase family family [Burkholderia thailandensis E264]|uniref:Oxidoreductase, short chain dehydrogenase/reductase family family n=2 Tax=Burkholderia thailandensis TaxID=57975 RepID=Q2SZS8_BURTA|nr:oxidoreductase, short chain dehydrogenase/reductase family family [Burkholderia thailandensis E264]